MRRQVISLAINALALTALAFVPAQAADNAAIKEKAAVCSGCHGENGISQTENIPSLAGQPDQFLQWQLVFFRAGSRKNDQMQPIAEEITNEDVRNFGAYFSQMTPPKGEEDKDPDLSKKGAQVAVGRRCASCHTDSFAGTKAVARLAGQREEYLVKALRDYKTNQRVGGGGGRDGRCRLSHERRGDHGRLALSRVFQVAEGAVSPPAASHTPSNACTRCAASAPAPWRHRRAR
ncbi:cytochrome c553 [Bradyrhizobium sp. LM3.6]